MPDAVMFSASSTEWGTPASVLDPLHERYDFTYDPAASHVNAKCALYSTVDGTYRKTRTGPRRIARATGGRDGLTQWWCNMGGAEHTRARVFVNPPYGRGVDGTLPWVRKAQLEAAHGALVVMLLASRTDTGWFHDYVQGSAEITFLRGRISFDRTADCCAHREDEHWVDGHGYGCYGCSPRVKDGERTRSTDASSASRHRYARIGESVGAPFPSMVAVYR